MMYDDDDDGSTRGECGDCGCTPCVCKIIRAEKGDDDGEGYTY